MGTDDVTQPDPRYDVLFEEVRIGPVTAPNRFVQVPHCTGVSDSAPEAVARMREIKAEGGWGIVSTEIAEVGPESEFWPFPSLHLWHDDHIAPIARMADAIHRHGALAAVELGHIGLAAGNRASRRPALGPASHPTLESVEPFQSRAMDASDIRRVREQHRSAARRARSAGFDVVYAYASHGLSIFSQFLQRRFNDRGDEYGGSLENRARLLREALEDMKEDIGESCAVAFRFAVNEIDNDPVQGRELVEMLKDIPDLWDVNISEWPSDSQTSRFAKEGFQEQDTAFVKSIVDRPVVGVGRFTSPDTMVSQIRRGIMDLVGAARPSIADPFLPRKVQEGRPDDIRECIGCNVCVSGELSYSPIRCTQNPTMMEELRRGWHPENLPPAGSDDTILIIGGGPAGLECAHVLARRGYTVTLAEAREELGGRVLRESALPGLGEWRRVADHRIHGLQQMANAELYTSSALDAETALSFGAQHIVVATGATWRRDGRGRWSAEPVTVSGDARVLTPDDIMDGTVPSGRVVVYDEDGTYLGNVIAELLKLAGADVMLVTPASEVAPYLALTMEQHIVAARMIELEIPVIRLKSMSRIADTHVVLDCVHGGEGLDLQASSVVLVTSRAPDDSLYRDLCATVPAEASISKIGDCDAPHLIAGGVHAGYIWAHALDNPFERTPSPLPHP